MNRGRLARTALYATALMAIVGATVGAAQAQRGGGGGGEQIVILRKDGAYTFFLQASGGAVRYCKLTEGYSSYLDCGDWV